MADPLSIATGVIGILTAAVQISSLLVRITTSTKNAPAQARHILTEVNDINAILSQLQSFLLGKELVGCSRTSLLKVDQVVTIVSGCVMTFSELEKLLDEMKVDHMSVLDRVKWARKEGEIQILVQRLQNHKASLTLITTILNGSTVTEAKDSVDRLCDIVDRRYQEMSSRVHALELREMQKMSSTPSLILSENEPSMSALLNEGPDAARNATINGASPSFWEELEKSRVYRKIPGIGTSIFSADQFTITSSYLSRFSLAEVSNISVINLAVTTQEVYNHQRLSQSWFSDQINSLWASQPQTEWATSVATLASEDFQPVPRTFSASFETDSSSIETVIEGAQHVDSVENSSATHPKATSGSAQTALYVRAMDDYENDDIAGLTIRQGDIIQVITQLESGWWDGITNGIRGWFPSNYCETVAGPEDLTARDTRLRSSSGTNLSGESSTEEEYKHKEGRSGSHSARERSAADSREKREQDVNTYPVIPLVDIGRGFRPATILPTSRPNGFRWSS